MNPESVSKYMIDDSGRISREGEHIATRNAEGQLEFVNPNDRQKYSAAIIGWLKKEDEKPKPSPEPLVKAAGAAEVVASTADAPKLTEADRQAAENRSLAAEGARETAKYLADVQGDRDFATANGCPQPPKKNPQFGDKTPAYVEWLKQFRPDKFKEKFGVKGKGKVAVFEKDPETGVEKHVGYREADMASRKTHLTEKIESQGDLGADLDWNA